ncbi:MAG TPA: 30S ribosomal protein S6 [Patescibacteria group bacterium]|nr:30S ribosomal protein S6 [Patescibacteria group bacterium]
MPTRYELLYIIPATLTDDEIGAVETKVNGLMTKVGVELESTKRLGKFRLTYPIKHQRHGHYVLVMVKAEPSTIGKLDEQIRLLGSQVVRHLILRADEAASDQKFDLVQFTEVNVETDRPKRREKGEEKDGKEGDIKAGVQTLEESKKEEGVVEEKKAPVSSEELDKKIESALSGDIEGV